MDSRKRDDERDKVEGEYRDDGPLVGGPSAERVEDRRVPVHRDGSQGQGRHVDGGALAT